MADRKNTIGRFEIIEKIGEGPIGSVYKALDPVIRRTVAIKVIKLYALEESATFAEVFEKIYRVVRTSTSLNHPNICIIYDLSEEKKIPYITMEYVDGHDLDWMLQSKHQFKRAQVLNIVQQVCDALDFAHKKNVIHQDLKASNIILTSDLHVKITDFGIAGLDEIAAAQTKKLLSIPYYIAPEQALGEKVTPSSDLFSLGVVLYQILSGQLPFPGNSAANVIMMIARDNPATPKLLEKSGIKPEDWNSFFNVALAKSPGQRFRSANEMYSALQKILPLSETSYFPYHVTGGVGESTGKFESAEKTYVGDSPTMMIMDANKMIEDAVQSLPNQTPQAETISIPIPDVKSPKRSSDFESTTSIGPEKESSFPSLESVLAQNEAKMSEVVPPESSATMIVDHGEDLIRASREIKMDPEPPPPMAPTQMIPTPDFAQSPSSTQSRSQTRPPAPPPPAPPAPPKKETHRPTPPPLEPPPIRIEPQAAKAQTMKPTPIEDLEEVAGNSPTQMIPIPTKVQPEEPVHQPTKLISMPAASPAKTNPPMPAPPIPPKQSIPESPYSLPSSPKPDRVAAPPGSKSALKIYWLAAIIAALIIAIVGAFIIIPKLLPDKKVVEPPAPEPKPPVVDNKPKPKPIEVPPAVTTGKIIVNSEPTGATVLLNEEEKGVTPMEIPSLAFGKYVLKLKLKGYDESQQEVELSENITELNVPVTLTKTQAQTGSIVVDSNPSGAFIVVGSRVLGTTPKTLSNQKPGNLDITLKKDGYHDFSGTVKVTAGKKATFSGSLEEIKKVIEKPVEPPKPVEPEVKPGQLMSLDAVDSPPKATKRVPAKYPDMARKLKLQGSVGLNVLISETGAVLDAKVVTSAHPILDQAAVDAVKQWTFEPASKKGVKVKVWYPVKMAFQSR
jgi:TonB family protein